MGSGSLSLEIGDDVWQNHDLAVASLFINLSLVLLLTKYISIKTIFFQQIEGKKMVNVYSLMHAAYQ